MAESRALFDVLNYKQGHALTRLQNNALTADCTQRIDMNIAHFGHCVDEQAGMGAEEGFWESVFV